MKKTFTIIFSFIVISSFSQNTDKSIYSGGMLFLQPGYTFTSNNHQNINDGSLGLGGIIRFYFYKYLTAGIYGGTQKTKYSSTQSESSYMNFGYGGPFIGLSHKTGRFRYTASAFVGKGSVKNLHIESQTNNTLTEAYFYKYSAIVFSPLLSVDFALSQKLLLTFQTICLTAKFDGNKTLFNPTFQIGILFNR